MSPLFPIKTLCILGYFRSSWSQKRKNIAAGVLLMHPLELIAEYLLAKADTRLPLKYQNSSSALHNLIWLFIFWGSVMVFLII